MTFELRILALSVVLMLPSCRISSRNSTPLSIRPVELEGGWQRPWSPTENVRTVRCATLHENVRTGRCADEGCRPGPIRDETGDANKLGFKVRVWRSFRLQAE